MHLGNPALHFNMSCIVLHLFAFIYYFFPLFLPIAPETDAAQETDYAAEDPAFAAERPGKQPPLTHTDITYFLLPPACIRNCRCYDLSYFFCIAYFCNCYLIPAY
jgi:hypothetical protein